MKKNRLIFYAFFAFFHLFIFIFSVYVDTQKDNISFLLSMQKKIWMLKYGSFIGLVLLVTDIVWILRSEKTFLKDKARMEADMNNLKAKLYDLQEAASKATPPRVGE